jgi:sugar lactone lactonase YvrE
MQFQGLGVLLSVDGRRLYISNTKLSQVHRIDGSPITRYGVSDCLTRP